MTRLLSMKNLHAAAAKGDVDSQFSIGVVYDNGLDDSGRVVARKRGEAIKWLLKAAEQGLPRAQQKLAEVYSDGTGTPDDSVDESIRACAWFLVAEETLAGAYREAARLGFRRTSSSLTPEEIATAHRFAGLWGPKSRIDAAARGETL